MLKKTRMLRMNLLIEIFLVKFMRYLFEMFTLKSFASITNKNLTIIFKLSIENQNNKFMTNPILIPHQINLLIFPLHQRTIIFPFLHFISFQLNQILNLFHSSPNIISLRYIHTKSKYLQRCR